MLPTQVEDRSNHADGPNCLGAVDASARFIHTLNARTCASISTVFWQLPAPVPSTRPGRSQSVIGLRQARARVADMRDLELWVLQGGGRIYQGILRAYLRTCGRRGWLGRRRGGLAVRRRGCRLPRLLRPVRIGFTAMLSGRSLACAGSTACRRADAIFRDVASATPVIGDWPKGALMRYFLAGLQNWC